MRNEKIALTITAVLASLSVSSASAGDKSAKHMAVHDLEWIETPFGPEAAVIAGDYSGGQHITFIKFSAGMTTPVHTHSNDYVGIVISGVTRHWLPDQPETRKLLPAGSHWSIPGGADHVSECLPGSDCVMAIYQDEAFDFLPSE